MQEGSAPPTHTENNTTKIPSRDGQISNWQKRDRQNDRQRKNKHNIGIPEII